MDYKFRFKAERISLLKRQQLGIGSNEKLCAFRLAELLGVTVVTPSALNMTSKDLHILLVKDKSAFSALVIPSKDGNFLIVHNSSHSPSRQQSNICHELAHIICEHKFSPFGVLNDFPLPMRTYDRKHENEAEYLGGCLQIPRKALVWSLDNKMNIEQIASYYGASQAMVRYRINITGLSKTYSQLKIS